MCLSFQVASLIRVGHYVSGDVLDALSHLFDRHFLPFQAGNSSILRSAQSMQRVIEDSNCHSEWERICKPRGSQAGMEVVRVGIIFSRPLFSASWLSRLLEGVETADRTRIATQALYGSDSDVGSHYIACCFDKKRGKVLVADSMRYSSSAVKPLDQPCRFVEGDSVADRLLDLATLLDVDKDWELEEVPTPSQPPTGNDCGAYAFVNTLALLLDEDLGQVWADIEAISSSFKQISKDELPRFLLYHMLDRFQPFFPRALNR